MTFKIEQIKSSSRQSFDEYRYNIYHDELLIARYWHGYRGDDHGIDFINGASEFWPVGRMVEFVDSGGPQPLMLTSRAIYISTVQQSNWYLATMIVKFLAFLLILVAAYLNWWAVEYAAPFWFVAAAFPLLCGVGLFFRRRWAGFLWYSLALVTSAWWIFTVLRMAFNGWPVQRADETLISLIPGVLLLVVCVGGTFAVRRKFRQIGPL